MKKQPIYLTAFCGGDERLWTSAALTNPSSLANCPLQPLGYVSIRKAFYLDCLRRKFETYTTRIHSGRLRLPNLVVYEKSLIFQEENRFFLYNKKMAERVGFEPTVGYKPTPIFKTGAINQLDHLSMSRDSNYLSTFYCRLSILFINFLLD